MKSISRIRVIYADTDAMGIVYHTNYIRWFEIGRTEWLREAGFIYADWEQRVSIFPSPKSGAIIFFSARVTIRCAYCSWKRRWNM